MHNKFKYVLDIIKPVQTQHELIRIGGSNDGGYLVPNDLENIVSCYSAGVGDVISFEKCLYEQYNIKSHLVDYSVDSLPEEIEHLSFDRYLLSNQDKNEFITLPTWMRNKHEVGDFILQMDIDGSEFDVINSTPINILSKFRILVIEFHLDNIDIKDPSIMNKIIKCFCKISKSFYSVHIHPNNCCGNVDFGNDIIFPTVFEVSFLRKDRCQLLGICDQFPHPLDQKNVSYKEDLILSFN